MNAHTCVCNYNFSLCLDSLCVATTKLHTCIAQKMDNVKWVLTNPIVCSSSCYCPSDLPFAMGCVRWHSLCPKRMPQIQIAIHTTLSTLHQSECVYVQRAILIKWCQYCLWYACACTLHILRSMKFHPKIFIILLWQAEPSSHLKQVIFIGSTFAIVIFVVPSGRKIPSTTISSHMLCVWQCVYTEQ